MNAIATSLAELVEILNDGIEFYLGAASKVSDSELVKCFQHMSNLKKSIASDLNAEIAIQGDAPLEHGSFAGTMRKAYADIIAKLSDDTAQQYISKLEEHEDRLLAAFREAVLGDPSSRVRDLALLYFPEIDNMHAEMRRMKQDRSAG